MIYTLDNTSLDEVIRVMEINAIRSNDCRKIHNTGAAILRERTTPSTK